MARINPLPFFSWHLDLNRRVLDSATLGRLRRFIARVAVVAVVCGYTDASWSQQPSEPSGKPIELPGKPIAPDARDAPLTI
jgi:hypothetical protein